MTKKAESTDNNEPVQIPLFNINRKPEIQPLKYRSSDELLVALLALKSIKGVGFRTLCSLFDNGFLSDIFLWTSEETAEKLGKLEIRNISDFTKTLIANKEKIFEHGIEAAKQLKEQNFHFIPLDHPDYPQSFHLLSEPPRWLFVKGNLDVIKSPSIVGVVGTRSPTIDGQRLAYFCASQLVRRNLVVLSGLAKGIDEKAHKGAVDFYGQSIAVLGYGFNELDSAGSLALVDQILEFDGAVISEYLPTEQASRNTFLRRNELQVALSKVIIPIESPSLESGTGATIRRAKNINVPIVGITTSTNSINENNLVSTRENLIKLGAKIYSLKNGESSYFWEFLKNVMPEHDWESGSSMRQGRLFRGIELQVIQAKKKLDLDDAAIDRLADQLKKAIK
ncbi:MAG TPA: DNA-processing protein DprA [Longilinea sp.]|nr:DNA-processing protein DprA [Longilinea sp.]